MWVRIPPVALQNETTEEPLSGGFFVANFSSSWVYPRMAHTINVVRIGEISPHPNADRLGLTYCQGQCLVIALDAWATGDLAVHVPPDFIIPEGVPWAPEYLAADRKVRSAKLRGVYSLGVLIPLSLTGLDAKEGDDVMQALGITRYVDEELSEWEVVPPFRDTPVYRVEYWGRSLTPVFTSGEEVLVTEKLHGQSARYTWSHGKLWVGSRSQWLTEDSPMPQIRAVEPWLKELCQKNEGIIFYGETIGCQKGSLYGFNRDTPSVRLFDAFWSNPATEPPFYRWLNVEEFESLVPSERRVPPLYRGPYREGLVEELAQGVTFTGYDIREGVVIRPVTEKFRPDLSRCVLKYVSPAFLAKK